MATPPGNVFDLRPRYHGDVTTYHVNPETFWERVAIRAKKDSPCWLWLGHVNDRGYGMFGAMADTPSGSTSVRAHRVAWELTHGPIPDGLTIDHLCRNRACVNPDHLEPVTMAENVRRTKPYRLMKGPGGRDATIVARPRSDGGTSYRVLYRLDRKQRSITFRDKTSAERFRDRVRVEGIGPALLAEDRKRELKESA